MSEPAPPRDPSADRRSALEDEAELLRERVRELDTTSGELPYDDGFADSGQVAAERGENRLLYDQLRRELDDIETALSRMDDGTYGTCEVCGKPISEARLEMLPATRYCIEHA